MKTIGLILAGLIIGAILFVLGAADDAPGLCFLGLVIAFLLTMRGLYHAKIIRAGYAIPMILLVFGVVGLFFPVVLYLDNEIKAGAMLIGNAIGIVLLVVAVLKLRKRVKKDGADITKSESE